MSSYIPPHKRKMNNIAPIEDPLEKASFPTLGGSGVTDKSKSWSASPLTFQDTASKPKPQRRPTDVVVSGVGMFIPASKKPAVSEYSDYAEESSNADDADDDGWTTVTRKVRRKKTAVEKYEEELREEEEKKKKEDDEKKESVWNDVNEYETYWDERRY